MTKEFDIVVHGATGFTGRLIAEYLLTRSDSGLKWAMGGRSMEKLQAVRAEIGAPASTPLLVIESSDEASLKSLMSKTRLVISAVGPYQLYGNELVKACAESGVDYVDLCGEPAWMRHMIDQHQASAAFLCSALVLVNHLAHPGGFAAQVNIVNAGFGTGFDQFVAVQLVGANC